MHQYIRIMHRYMINPFHQKFTYLTVCIDAYSHVSMHKAVLCSNSFCFSAYIKDVVTALCEHEFFEGKTIEHKIKSSVAAIVGEHIET